MEPLPDGIYDIFIVDASPATDDDRVVQLELTVVAGEHKGEVVALRMRGGRADPIEMIGLPGRMVVSEGQPRLQLDR